MDNTLLCDIRCRALEGEARLCALGLQLLWENEIVKLGVV